jgi:CysZ protein
LLKEIIIAIQAYIKAHQFIKQHRLWKWIIIPGILYTTLFVVSMYYFGLTANLFIGWLSQVTGLTAWLGHMHDGFLGFLFALSGLFFWLNQMLLYFSLFKYIWLIVGSPVFAYLSEKTEAMVQGKSTRINLSQLRRDALRGCGIAARNALWQTVYMVTILLLTLVPLIGWATPLLAVLLDCYYFGFSMLDYSSERKNVSPAESIYFIGSHRGLAIGNGLVFYLMHPVILIAPAYAIIAATLSMHELEQRAGKVDNREV